MDTGQEARERNSHYCPHPHGGAKLPPRQDAVVVIIIAYLCPIIDDRMLPPSPCPHQVCFRAFPTLNGGGLNFAHALERINEWVGGSETKQCLIY
ncbi:hypothetical protein DdX_13076 [Ditylenchus destructor]|uniref:Uncharacterized protein n=1 Tax=Ditylenchus destructor TaxID=166010 RepID=A0AAD4MWS3_9BILA|nr:hypothetical protein DdX_13076 [Ditylenchus destructor]